MYWFRRTGTLRPVRLRRACNLLGFINEITSRTGRWRGYTERQEYDKIMSVLRGAIEEHELATLMKDGTAWSEDQAIAEALAI